MKRLLIAVVILGVLGGAGFWLVTAPRPLPADELAEAISSHPPDLRNGELIFNMGGCVACHAAKGAKDADRLKLLGGQALVTPFGTFRVPNISPDRETGIGSWRIADIVNAVTRGVSPDGQHYYPAFPYAGYARMKIEDAIDLAGYLKTLPAVSNKVAGHDLKFPFNIRRGLGLWKLLYLHTGPVIALTNPSDSVKRGQYIVEGAGHCGECHTPRNPIGGPDVTRWLAGAPALEAGAGNVPDITPDAKALGGWSASDIAGYLETGFTPDGDVVGGAMAEVVSNIAKLPKSDREAIAAYLKAIPPVAPPPKPSGS
jgi:mono/diheme cytochrome c family protein